MLSSPSLFDFLVKLLIKEEITMATITDNTNLRYQVYGLDNKGNLSYSITRPIYTKESIL